jgi:hypothetical protein
VHDSNSRTRFNGRRFGYLAACFAFFCCVLWILGDTFCTSVTAADRITGAQAVASLQAILGSPEQFIADMKATTQDFIHDHFGSLAMAAAFGIAVRMRS